jgi:urea transport system permease protein
MRQPLVLKILENDKGGKIVLSTLAVVVLVVAFCNLFVPADSVFYISTFTVTILGKYLAFALLALALDLVWGYLGVLSLGHGAFFALGGYAWAMYLMRQIGDRGVYGNPELPDFMVFMNLKELPWFWYGFDNPLFALFMVGLVPGLLAFVFGWLAFKSRVTGVYLSIITQALTYALMLAFFRNDMGFGGNNGLTDFKDILGFDLQADTTRVGLLIITFLALAAGYLICRFIINSRLGRVVISIRDAESRVRFLGYKVEQYKLFIFVVSAVLAAIAGALYVPQVGIINPGVFSPLFSIELAMIVSLASSYFTSALPEVWLYALGALFVVVTLYLPKGVVGLISQINSKVKKA